MPQMTVELIRTKLKTGEVTLGSWMQIPDENVALLMGAAGYDWVALDLEHGRFAENDYPGLFRAIAEGGTVPFVRLGRVTAYAVKAALDGGAGGVIFPNISSAAMLREAISWSHYPPRGTRGVGYSSANLFGQNLKQALAEANPIAVAQIEQAGAVDDIDAILDVPGLDAIIIGPYDLSASMGITAQFDHPDFVAALQKVAEACCRHKIPSGLHVVMPEPEKLRAAIDGGNTFIAYGIDAVFLWSGAAAPGTMRRGA